VAANAVIGRALMVGGIYVVSSAQSLTLMSVAASACAIAANGALYLSYRRVRAAAMRGRGVAGAILDRREELMSVAKECVPLSVWAIATFAIYGGTSTISSLLDFSHFAAYTIAVGISLVFLGLHSAAFSTLIPHVAHTQKAHGPAALVSLLRIATTISVAISCAALIGTMLVGDTAVAWMVPAMASHDIMSYLLPLLVGNAIRLVGLPYSNALVGLGLQSRITRTPLVEAGVTLIAALVLGLRFGATGVAWSLCVGGLASIAMHVTFNVRITHDSLPVTAMRVLLLPLGAVLAASIVGYAISN
jgi:O-antigen/teichoic acid export membrane protein